MLTLLKGESIQSMRKFFSDSGMRSMIIRTDLVVSNSWLDHLLAKPSDDHDNMPITWIRRMIERRPSDRPSSEEIASWTIGTANASKFCCPLCMDEDEIHSQDELLPSQLEEAPMWPDTPATKASTTQDLIPNLDGLSSNGRILGVMATASPSPSSSNQRLLLNSTLSPSHSQTSGILQPTLQQGVPEPAPQTLLDRSSSTLSGPISDDAGGKPSGDQANISGHQPEYSKRLTPGSAGSIHKAEVEKNLAGRDKTKGENYIFRTDGNSSGSDIPTSQGPFVPQIDIGKGIATADRDIIGHFRNWWEIAHWTEDEEIRLKELKTLDEIWSQIAKVYRMYPVIATSWSRTFIC
jgi:hypothetical protein